MPNKLLDKGDVDAKEDNKNHGSSPAPHGDVLKKAKEQLKKKVMI